MTPSHPFRFDTAGVSATMRPEMGGAMNRLRLLQLVTLMLYGGPLVAGLAGHGWSSVLPFAAIFVLWQIVMRPADWPRDVAQWGQPPVIIGAFARTALMVVLVGACFGIGRGIGGIVGHLPAIPEAAPLALSFLSVPLARMFWDPVKEAQMDAFLDTAIRDINAAARGPDATHIAQSTALADRLLDPLAALDPATPLTTLADHLKAIALNVDDARIRDALLARAGRSDAPRTLLSALVLHSTDGRLIEILGGDYPTRAFHVLPDDAALLATYATRLHAALAEDADLWGDIPNNDFLAERAARLTGTEAEAPLHALIALSTRLAPPDTAT